MHSRMYTWRIIDFWNAFMHVLILYMYEYKFKHFFIQSILKRYINTKNHPSFREKNNIIFKYVVQCITTRQQYPPYIPSYYSYMSNIIIVNIFILTIRTACVWRETCLFYYAALFFFFFFVGGGSYLKYLVGYRLSLV